MLATSQIAPALGFSSTHSIRQHVRPLSKDGAKQAIWVPMLNSASKGKDLTEKQLVVLGGTPSQQREFLEQLNPSNLRPRFANNDRRRQQRSAPVSNEYALGYTYHDVLDADQEHVLARLNVYMLSSPSSNFAPLLNPLFTAKTVKDTLVTILLDWSDPFKWARQLRQCIRLLRLVVMSLDEETKIQMEEVMTAWKNKTVGSDVPFTQLGGSSVEHKLVTSATTLGPGEWDEGLGIPLSVVCVHAEKIEQMERDHGWGEDQFDFLMQWLRCVLLKHGASLVYTATFDPNNVRTLVHSCLNIHSLLKRDVARHNIVDRDKILIPPNWDSWGKIKILKDGFDPESVGNAWSIEIQSPPEDTLDLSSMTASDQVPNSTESEAESAVQIFELTLHNPATSRPSFQARTTTETVTVPPVQHFLQEQLARLEALKAEDEKEQRKARKGAPAPTGAVGSIEDDDPTSRGIANARMAEYIGPFQLNVNGIDTDMEEATRRLREKGEEERKASTAPRPSRDTGTSTPMRRMASDAGSTAEGAGSNTPNSQAGGKQSNEAMSAFFANLIKKEKRGGVSSGASPTRGPGSPLVRAASSTGAGEERRASRDA